MEIDEIERKIASGEMSAAQVFTQMRQHIISRNKVLSEAMTIIGSCELVPADKGVYRIRLHEALGALECAKERNQYGILKQ